MATAVITAAAIGFVLALGLVVASRFFHVEVDPRIEAITEVLPGANCGGCGLAGCAAYAALIVNQGAGHDLCGPGGAQTAAKIAAILGVDAGDVEEKRAVVCCAGDRRHTRDRFTYLGVQDCAAAASLAGGFKACSYGCLGLGTCERICPFHAIRMTEHGVAWVDPEVCTGCRKCVDACPRGIIRMAPKGQAVQVLCASKDKAKDVKAACDVGCTGCKLCTKQSPRLVVEDNLASVSAGTDDIPEAAALVCPQGAIHDSRKYPLVAWLESPASREDFAARQERYKEARKARRDAAPKPEEGATA